MSGLVSYLVFFGVMAGIYAVLALALDLQWGFTGLFNVGIAGFFAVGAYTSAVLTTPSAAGHLGGFSLPFPAGLAGAICVSGLLAVIVGIPTLRLSGDYLAIATIGIAETVRLVFTNEDWLSHGVRGIRSVPRPLQGAVPFDYNVFYLVIVAAAVALVALALRRALRSPWGRVLRAVREDEVVTQALGKNVFRFRLESLVLGSMIMGAGGSLYAHFIGFVSPDAFKPMQFTFLVWVMLIVGGSGRIAGAVLGAFLVWGVWSGTEFLTLLLPAAVQTKAGALRVIAIAVVLEAILLLRPEGVLGKDGRS